MRAANFIAFRADKMAAHGLSSTRVAKNDMRELTKNFDKIAAGTPVVE
jgi:hypothetical protein